MHDSKTAVDIAEEIVTKVADELDTAHYAEAVTEPVPEGCDPAKCAKCWAKSRCEKHGNQRKYNSWGTTTYGASYNWQSYKSPTKNIGTSKQDSEEYDEAWYKTWY